jgi:hypothetical protein
MTSKAMQLWFDATIEKIVKPGLLWGVRYHEQALSDALRDLFPPALTLRMLREKVSKKSAFTLIKGYPLFAGVRSCL